MSPDLPDRPAAPYPCGRRPRWSSERRSRPSATEWSSWPHSIPHIASLHALARFATLKSVFQLQRISVLAGTFRPAAAQWSGFPPRFRRFSRRQSWTPARSSGLRVALSSVRFPLPASWFRLWLSRCLPRSAFEPLALRALQTCPVFPNSPSFGLADQNVPEPPRPSPPCPLGGSR